MLKHVVDFNKPRPKLGIRLQNTRPKIQFYVQFTRGEGQGLQAKPLD